MNNWIFLIETKAVARAAGSTKYKHEWKQTIAGPENTTTQPQDSTL